MLHTLYTASKHSFYKEIFQNFATSGWKTIIWCPCRPPHSKTTVTVTWKWL